MSEKVNEEVKEKIAEICKQVILQEEVVKLKQQTEQQLNYARGQLIIWDTKVKQLTGSLGTLNVILEISKELDKKKS